MACLKAYFTNCKEYWYMWSRMGRSFITKYKIEPRILTSLYWFLVSSNFYSSIRDSWIFLFISSQVFLLCSRVEIKFTSSSKVSYLLSFSSYSISFSNSDFFCLKHTKFNWFSYRCYSFKGSSFIITSDKSYTSTPSKFTVKFITFNYIYNQVFKNFVKKYNFFNK